MFRGLLTAILIFAAGIAQAQELKVGNTYRKSVQLTKDSGGVILPLPKGEWQLVALEESRHAESGVNLAKLNGALVLLDLSKQGRIKSFVTFNMTASDMFYGGWKVPDFCNSSPDDVLHLEKIEARQGKNIRCWGIKFYAMTKRADAQWLRTTQDWIRQNTKQAPALVVSITYMRAAGPKLLDVRYFFNPVAAGLPATGWTSAAIAADEKKKKYIERLTSFGTRWEPRVETGFNGKQP